MTIDIDIQALRHEAEAALQDRRPEVVAGWPTSPSRGRAYVGAVFDFAGERWVVVRGPQRPDAARLLDATAAFRHAAGAARGLAILDPDAKPNAKRSHAPDIFRTRFQTAAWHGLGIVWVETTGPGAWSWTASEQHELGDLKIVAEAVHSKLLTVATPEWALLKKSRDAEAEVRPVITQVLAGLGFKLEGRSAWRFPAFWRNSETDGLWRRTAGRFPATLALEVKVNEDAEAPLCQAFDDLGQFDAVLYVRLLSATTRTSMLKRKGMHEAMRQVEEKLPVRYIELDVASPREP